MTIDKAIKTLEDLLDSNKGGNEWSTPKAIQLGIEALEEVKYYRNNPVSYVLKRLIGEAEE